MRLSQQEYWSELPFPPPEDLSDPEIDPNNVSQHWQAGSLMLSHLGAHIQTLSIELISLLII